MNMLLYFQERSPSLDVWQPKEHRLTKLVVVRPSINLTWAISTGLSHWQRFMTA
jgi:hypothetical protein